MEAAVANDSLAVNQPNKSGVGRAVKRTIIAVKLDAIYLQPSLVERVDCAAQALYRGK
jgi:hypothetical protein